MPNSTRVDPLADWYLADQIAGQLADAGKRAVA